MLNTRIQVQATLWKENLSLETITAMAKNNQIILIHHDEQLTAYWKHNGGIIKRSIPEKDGRDIISLLSDDQAADMSKDSTIIHTILSRFGCDKKLSVALAKLENYFPFAKKTQTREDAELQGSWNTFQTQQHPVSRQRLDPTEHPDIARRQENKYPIEKTIRVAIQHLKLGKESKTKQIKNAMRHLRELTNNAIDAKEPTCIQDFLYFGDKGKVSITASCDLFTWMKKNNEVVTLEQIQEFIAQILIAVNRLHSDDKVHRDIKLENILVYEINGETYIKLADIDETVSINENNLSLVGTWLLLGPEITKAITKSNKNTDSRYIVVERYNQADKKALDCYAIGALASNMLTFLNHRHEFTWLQTFGESLMSDDPKSRFTIDNVMTNGTFSQDYLTKVKEKCKVFETIDIYYDGYYQNPKRDRYPEYDDAFLMLPKPLKEIYLLARSLESQMKLVYEHTIGIYELDKIQQTINALRDKLNAYGTQNPAEIINSLKDGVKEAQLIITSKTPKKAAVWARFKNSLFPPKIIPTEPTSIDEKPAPAPAPAPISVNKVNISEITFRKSSI